ncbi:MAG TPA: transcriptional regulator [Opitutaceae bacterium]|jgi:DNA-binding MarR family transcriptional regulator
MAALDPIIHQPARLQIMAALCTLKDGNRVDFSFLKDSLALTDGNLGAHLSTLESKGYVTVEKEFVGRRPKTFLSVTAPGKDAFQGHVEALRAILSSP